MRKSFALVAVLCALSLRAETYTASDVKGDVEWSSILSDWVSGDSSEAEITLTGDATITLPSGFSAKSITFTGDYDVTLKEASGVTTLSSITTLTGGVITRVIPAGCAEAVTVPAGLTYLLSNETETETEYAQTFTVNGTLEVNGSLVLSSTANAVAKAGALTVTGGTAKIAFGERAMQGTLTVAKGATLIPTSNDAPNYSAGNTDVWSVRVYGTLTFASSRWTVKMGELHLYGGATIDGAGNNSYAIDFYNKIFLHKVDTDEETTATISAPIRWSNGTRQITVEEG